MRYEEFKEKAMALKTITSVTGATYTVVYVLSNQIRLRRESTRKTFILDLMDLYKTFGELYLSRTPITTKTLEPTMDTAKSAALGVLIAVGLVKSKQRKKIQYNGKKETQETTT